MKTDTIFDFQFIPPRDETTSFNATMYTKFISAGATASATYNRFAHIVMLEKTVVMVKVGTFGKPRLIGGG